MFAYADTKTKMTSAGPAYNFYDSGSWDDDYALAAALLYKATGKSTYADKYNRVYGNKSNPNWGLCWNNVDPLALLYSPQFKGKSAFVENQSGVISNFTKSYDNNYCLIDSWGSARYNAAHQMTGLMYDKINSKNDYSAWANGQMKYLLGNNAGSRCFVVGYNKYSVKHPHHRAASGYGDVASNQYTDLAHVITGALVGGPSDSSKNFDDNANQFQYTEVALDYNAGLVGAAAGLYLYVKNSGTDEEKAVQRVVPKSEVSSELRTISGAIEVVTPSSNPYLIDAGKLNDNIYVGTLVDDAGTPTVKVTQKDGVISVSFTQNKNYTITGTGEAVVFDTGNASGVTISDAAVKKITVRPGKDGLFIINVSGSSTVADGITCVKDSENTADVKIVGKDSSAGISSSKSGAATIKSEGNLEISGIQIRSEGKGIEADGTVKISGGSNRIDAVSSAISASDVEMTGGSMDAASTGLGENESVISADNSIKLVGGSITADASGSTGGNSFGVKSDDGTIIVDGDTVVGGDPTYSKDPVDSNGNPATEPTTKPTTKPTTEPTTKPTTNPEPTTKPTTKSESTTATTTKKPTTEKPTTAPSPQPSKDNKTVKVTKITLDKTSIILKVGESSQIRATVKPVNATNSGVIWSSSDISKVSVQSNGKISALGEGTATITVTARDGSGVNAKCKVTVTKKSSASNVGKPKQTDIRKTAKVTYRTLVNKKNRAIYTGKAIAPKLTVKVNGRALKAGRDYKVKYAANKNIGKAKVIITGAGKYKGTVVKYFRITTAKGKIYKVGSYRYKITNPALNGKGTVMLMSVSGKTTVRVSDIVKIGGKKFKVTSIRSGAFKNNKRIKKVIIGRNVSVIGIRAFYGCRNLKSVIIRSSRLSLKNVGKSAFTRTYAKCVIRVPASKVKQYKKILVKRGVSRTAVIKR